MRTRAATVRAEGMVAVIGSSLERWFTPETRAQRPDIIDRVTKTLLADDTPTQDHICQLIKKKNIRTRLGEIRCPTLVLVGEHDPSTPPGVARGLFEAIPAAKIIVIPNASHIVSVEASTAINQAPDEFLKSVGYSGSVT